MTLVPSAVLCSIRSFLSIPRGTALKLCSPAWRLLGVSPLWVALFYCSRSGKTMFGHARKDHAPQLTHYIRQLMVSLSNFPLPALVFHVFLKKVIPAWAGDTFLKIDPHHFASKSTTFWIPNWSFKSQFSSLCSSLPLLCSFGSVLFRSWSQLGANLGPTCANLGPTSATLRPISANLGPSWC